MKSEYQIYLKYSAIGIEVSLSIVFGAYIGMKLDNKWGTSPWLLLAGLALGVATAIRALWRLYKDVKKEESKKDIEDIQDGNFE